MPPQSINDPRPDLNKNWSQVSSSSVYVLTECARLDCNYVADDNAAKAKLKGYDSSPLQATLYSHLGESDEIDTSKMPGSIVAILFVDLAAPVSKCEAPADVNAGVSADVNIGVSSAPVNIDVSEAITVLVSMLHYGFKWQSI